MKRKGILIGITSLLIVILLYVSNAHGLIPISTKEQVYAGLNKDQNLIMIQLEAFQDFVINQTINGKEITPNINKLAQSGIYFTNIYQQNGSGTTSDAEFMGNTGLLPLKPPNAVSTGAANLKLPSLPRLLEKRGYKTATLHTNDVLFWNRIEMYSSLGFGKYYDVKYFGKEDRITFGASDEVLYDKGIEVLKKFAKNNKKFYTQFISMSSHYPFKIPKTKSVIQVPSSIKDTFTGNYIEAASYADYAIGKFMQGLDESGLLDKTTIVIYGDHIGLKPSYLQTDAEKQLLKEMLGHNYDSLDGYNIPLIIYSKNLKHKTFSKVGGHSDIMPTISTLLGIAYDEKKVVGQNLFADEKNIVPMRYYEPEGSFYTNGVFYNSKMNVVTNLKTRETYQDINHTYKDDLKEAMQKFERSDQLLQASPIKKDSFGKEMKIHNTLSLYKNPALASKTMHKIQPGTYHFYKQKNDDWFQIKIDQKDYWIHPTNPIFEKWTFVKLKKRSNLYKKPNKKLKPVTSVSPQNLFVLKEWKGTGWYQIATSMGESLWIQVEQ